MRHSDSGAGRGKLIGTLAVLLAVAYVAIKTIPVYVHNYELHDYIGQLAIQATVSRAPAEGIRNNVVAKAQDLNLPVSPENVKVQAGHNVTILVDYTVPIDLKVYTWVLHFKPSAENRALL